MIDRQEVLAAVVHSLQQRCTDLQLVNNAAHAAGIKHPDLFQLQEICDELVTPNRDCWTDEELATSLMYALRRIHPNTTVKIRHGHKNDKSHEHGRHF